MFLQPVTKTQPLALNNSAEWWKLISSYDIKRNCICVSEKASPEV
jgi:hypothetical protein